MLPVPALAQKDDAGYCAALSAPANRYLVSGTGDGEGTPDIETHVAISDCSKGNTAAGIPVLERKLRSNGCPSAGAQGTLRSSPVSRR
jgi:hypothetical protein